MACLASSGVHSAYWSFSWPRKSPPKPNKPDLKSSFLHFLSREETYGAELYKIFPLCAPGEVGFEFSLEEQLTEPLTMQGSHILKKLIEENPAIVAGDGRTLGTQALMQVSQHHRQQRRKSRKKTESYIFQLVGLGVTLLVAVILGAATGLFISTKKLFETIPDDQLFNDELFWVIADDDNAGFDQPEVISDKGSPQFF